MILPPKGVDTKFLHNFLFIFFLLIVSCDNNDPSVDPIVLSDEVEIYVHDKLESSLVLAVENNSKEAYLFNKQGKKLYEWIFDDALAGDLELLPDGRLIGLFKYPEAEITFGGSGGIIRILNADGTMDWEYSYHSPDYIAHHDVEMLPNGNVIFLVWERIGPVLAQSNGIVVNHDVYPEALIEVDPRTNEIVWEWHSFDHLIQDLVPDQSNFGAINENPQLIDPNYHFSQNGDIMHANGIDYDTDKDVIYVSVNFYNEVWVIDHSASIAEAASHAGGNYGKGGDLIYRFGNPDAYKNTKGTRLFYRNHFPNLLEDGEPGSGGMLIYVNGSDVDQSTIYELRIPDSFNLLPGENNEPEIVWSFTSPLLFSSATSGAVRLDNGNTLICEGDYGFWEVTPGKEVVWKFNGGGPKYWRAYSYPVNDPAIINLGI